MATDFRGLEFSVDWASSPKWATSRESESISVVEAVDGNLGIVLVDVQGSGSSGGRRLALTLANFARNLLESGVAPAEVTIATHQHLIALREGKVSASIHCIWIDAGSGEVVVTGYGPLFAAFRSGDNWTFLNLVAELAGISALTGSARQVFNLTPGASLIVTNDGVGRLDELADWQFGAAIDANYILGCSHSSESGRPKSDKSVVVVSVNTSPTSDRRRTGRMTLPVTGRSS